MQRLVFFFLCLGAYSLMANDYFGFNSSLYKPTLFFSHAKEASPYLAINVFHYPVFLLKKQVEERFSMTLLDRGDEAHITVITPPEYNKLKSHLSMEEIENIAGNIQSISFEALCIGRGERTINGIMEQTYFIVIKSPALLALRQKIKSIFIAKRGNEGDFNPQEYFPHITLGFTKRDLHVSDGIVKDENSCIVPLQKIETSIW